MFEQNIRAQWWRPLWEFLIHVLVGTAIFLVVALAAVALSLFVNWLEALKIDTFVVRVVKGLEYFVLCTDALLYVIFIVWAFVQTTRRIWKR
jgi:hypothetical protein